MSVKRKLYKSEFKAKVALAAVRGDETSAQLSSKFGVHSAMVNSWRRILVSNAASLFEHLPGASMQDIKTDLGHNVKAGPSDLLHLTIGKYLE